MEQERQPGGSILENQASKQNKESVILRTPMGKAVVSQQKFANHLKEANNEKSGNKRIRRAIIQKRRIDRIAGVQLYQ